MTKKSKIDDMTHKKFADYFTQIVSSKAYRKCKPRERDIIKRLMFGNVGWPYIPLCNQNVEFGSREVLTKILSQWAFEKNERIEGPRRLHFITMLFADMFIDFDQPKVEMDKFKRRVREQLKNLSLHAFVFIEFEPTVFPSGGSGKKRAICCHVHGFCWSDDPIFEPINAVARLNHSRILKPVFGMEAIQIKAQKVHRETSINSMARYAAKLPVGLKKIAPGQLGSKREVNLYANRDGWTGKIAMRLIELYSLFSVDELTLATGDGAKLRSKWKRTLRTKAFKKCGRKILNRMEVRQVLRRVQKVYAELERIKVL